MGSISAQPSGSSGSNKALSNLASVAINTDLIPDGDGTRNLGSAVAAWGNMFGHQLNLPDTSLPSGTADLGTIYVDSGDNLPYFVNSDSKRRRLVGIPPFPDQFVAHPDNPFIPKFTSFLKVDSTYHAYYGSGSINHATSPDGVDWTLDSENNPLSGITSNNGVPSVWKEGATWHMLFRMDPGDDYGIGYASSSDGITWSPDESNPVLTGDESEWDDNARLDPWGVIKIGSTYYLYYSTVSVPPNRATGIATSTDLINWTKDDNNPIFDDHRYCIWVIKYGLYYYAFVPHYTVGTNYGEIELYRDVNPTFYAADREDLGEVRESLGDGWDSHDLDTPCILTDDVFRNTFDASNGEMWMYYAGELDGAWQTGLAIANGIQGLWSRNQDAANYDLVNVESLGVGVAAPAVPVHIKANSGHRNIQFEENSGTEGWTIGVDVDGDLNFYDLDNATPSLSMRDGTGNIGLGLTAPQKRLHLRDDSSTDFTQVAHENVDTTNSNGIVTRYYTATTGAGAANMQSLGGYQCEFMEHDHATRTAKLSWFTYVSGVLYYGLRVDQHVYLKNDGETLFFGAGDDSGINDSGDNLLINPDENSAGGARELRIGDGTTNYVGLSPTGDVSFAGSAGFYPRRVTQDAEPANGTGSDQIDVGEVIIWRDADDKQVWLMFNDTDEGIKKVELT